jgi:glycosyltransferase involved in cell wall biosynthesis
MRHQVNWLGRVEPERVVLLRKQALATVVPSRWDNHPYTVIEAMLQGCPLVAADTGGIGELIVHGVTGLLSPAGDVEALADSMQTMLDDPTAAREMGQRARALAATRHDPAIVARQTVAVYRRAMELVRKGRNLVPLV